MSSTLVLDPAKVVRRSSLGRDVDPRLPSNRLAIVGALLAALATGLAALAGLEIGLSPFSAALGVFLSWAIARELDPDHPAAAAIALPVSFVLLVLVGPSSLLVSTGLLLGARMTAGTVGTPLRLLDVVGIVALSALLGTSVVGAVGVAAMGVGVLVDEPRRERALAVVGSAAVAFAAAALVTDLMEARDERRLQRLQQQLAAHHPLIVDELGFVPLSKTGAELLFEVFSQRYE